MNEEESHHIKDLCILGEVLTSLVRAKHDIRKSVTDCYSHEMHDEMQALMQQLDIFMGVCNTLMLDAINQEPPYDQEE